LRFGRRWGWRAVERCSIEGQNSLQPKSLAGQEKGEVRIGNTVEPFDEPGGDFHCNPKGRGPFGRWRRCSSRMIG